MPARPTSQTSPYVSENRIPVICVKCGWGKYQRAKYQQIQRARKIEMKPLLRGSVLKAAITLFSCLVCPAIADYCTFDNGDCVDGLAQVSVSFQFDSISPAPILFYYGYDAGLQNPNDESSSAIKVGYWLQYDWNMLADFNAKTRSINWTTETALRIGNLGGYVSGANNGCDGVWGDECSENLKDFLRSSLFNLSISGVPYDLPLNTVLEPLTDGTPGPFIQGCPPTLFDLDIIPTYAVINATTAGSNNASQPASVAAPGNPGAPWRTWYIPHGTPLGQTKEVAVGIITRGPTQGSIPPNGPDDIQVELVCARAPKQGHHPPFDQGSWYNSPEPFDPSPSAQGYAPGIVKTYAFNDSDDFEYNVQDDDGDGDGDEPVSADYKNCDENSTDIDS